MREKLTSEQCRVVDRLGETSARAEQPRIGLGAAPMLATPTPSCALSRGEASSRISGCRSTTGPNGVWPTLAAPP
jgi:hypothetical protein